MNMHTKSMVQLAQRMPRELHQIVRHSADYMICELDRMLPLTAEQMEFTEITLRETLTGALCAVWMLLRNNQSIVEVDDE